MLLCFGFCDSLCFGVLVFILVYLKNVFAFSPAPVLLVPPPKPNSPFPLNTCLLWNSSCHFSDAKFFCFCLAFCFCTCALDASSTAAGLIPPHLFVKLTSEKTKEWPNTPPTLLLLLLVYLFCSLVLYWLCCGVLDFCPSPLSWWFLSPSFSHLCSGCVFELHLHGFRLICLSSWQGRRGRNDPSTSPTLLLLLLLLLLPVFLVRSLISYWLCCCVLDFCPSPLSSWFLSLKFDVLGFLPHLFWWSPPRPTQKT